jgi:circadian clock protein KaiC
MGERTAVAKTGIAGLDDVLCGGLPRNRIYLVQGDPGVGKTTLALQFLLEGLRAAEPCLYVTLSESHEEIEAVAHSHGWDITKLHVYELSAAEQSQHAEAENTLFVSSEVELHEATNTLLETIERVKPARVVIDSLSELRLLAQSPLRYRRQILSLKEYFVGRSCTALFLDDRTIEQNDQQLQSLAHGVIALHSLAPEYGADRRRLRVVKLRGVQFRGGFHDFVIRHGGVTVFPRLVAAEHHGQFTAEVIRSGNAALDDLLGGGIDRGTSTLILGPAGAGKSALASCYGSAAADRGEHVAMFLFDESIATMCHRSRALGMRIEEHIASERIMARQVDPAEMSPGELAMHVRHEVEARDARVVVIDSLNGYLTSMPEERFLTIQMHEMLSYLAQKGVATLLLLAQHGLVGSMSSPVDLSYLADTLLMLRYFEAEGAVLKAISVLKKRAGAHENTIRQFTLGAGGVTVGAPLSGFHGVLTGVPRFIGDSEALVADGARHGE